MHYWAVSEPKGVYFLVRIIKNVLRKKLKKLLSVKRFANASMPAGAKKIKYCCEDVSLLKRGNNSLLYIYCTCGQLTESVLEFHADDTALVALVDARAVPELRDPALGRSVRRPRVHQPVHQQQADHGVGVPVHHLGGQPIGISSFQRIRSGNQ